jgi:phospholipid-translocating ATPase
LFPFLLLFLDTFTENAFDAYQLRAVDKEKNLKEVQVLKDSSFQFIHSEDVQVGDLVIISKEESVCADILLLATDTSEEICFVDMKEIIGGKDLTKRKVVKEVQSFISQEGQDISNLLSHIENIKVTQPCASFQHFSGKIKMLGNPKAIKLTKENLILRESKIVSNQWVVGIVVYAGVETKVMINCIKQPLLEFSTFHLTLNKIMTCSTFVLLFLVFISFGIGFGFQNDEKKTWHDELISYFFLFYTSVPVSLYFFLRIVKNIARIFNNLMQKEVHIKDSKIFESIGKVEIVFAGKSGVLTEDELKVQACILKKRIWVDGEVCLMHGLKTFRSSEELLKDDLSDSCVDSFFELNEYVEGLFKDMEEKKLLDLTDTDLFYYVLCMMICNHHSPNKELSFISQDEKIVFEFGEKLGFQVTHRSINSAILVYSDFEYKFDILGTWGLYSEQGVNKIVVQNRETGEIVLLVKGKFNLMTGSFDSNDEALMMEDAMKLNICQFLQKIVCGYKVLNESEAFSFKFDYKTAKLSPVNVEGRIANVFDKYEKGLIFLGIIGIENPIKLGVKETISTLKLAGIKTWIVTGDSEESALLTGTAIGLYDNQSNIVKLNNILSTGECLHVLKSAESHEIFKMETRELQYPVQITGSVAMIKSEINLDQITNFPSNPIKKKMTRHLHRRTIKKKHYQIHPSLSNISDDCNRRISDKSSINFVMSVDASSFDLILTSAILKKKFLVLLLAAKAAFFYSMMPDQKGKLVNFIKNSYKFRPTVMAVADGNAYSAMLSQADIGVSIGNKSNKVNYSDRAKIDHFFSLSQLVVDIGIWADFRLAWLVLLCLYKSTVVNTVLFLFQINSQFSSFNLVSYDLVVLFDLFVTSLPLVFLGLFSKISVTESEKNSFYSCGFMGDNLRTSKILALVFEAFIHGLIIFLFVSFALPGSSLEIMGIAAYICICLGFFVKVISVGFSLWYLSLTVIVFYIMTFALVIPLILSHKITDYFVEDDEFAGQRYFWVVVVFTPVIMMIVTWTFSLVNQAQFKDRPANRFEEFEQDLGSCFKDVDEWRKLENADDIDTRFFHLAFKSPFREQEYQQAIIGHFRKVFKIFTFIGFVITWIVFILKYTVNRGTVIKTHFSVVPPIALTLQFVLGFYKKLNWKYFVLGSTFNCIFLTLFSLVDGVVHSFYRFRIFTYFFSIAINLRFRTTIFQVLIIFIVSIISVFIEESILSPSSFILDSFFCSVPILGTSLLCLVICYTFDINKRKQFITLKQIRNECQKAKNILSYLLPQFVRKRVKEGVRYIAEDKGTVSVIFVDMCGFDDIVNNYTPQELTSFLDDVFGRIDNLSESIGVTKIETVGKTYLACTGLKDSEEKMDMKLTNVPHARRAIEFGLAVIKEAEKIPLKDGSSLTFKIGINSGPVTAGVVGHHKPQFSLVGDTVNTASRMSSTLTEPNAVQITQATFGMIGNKSGLYFEDCVRDVKGKGKMDTKIVTMPKEIISSVIDRNGSMPSIAINSSFIGMGSMHKSLEKSDSEKSFLIDLELDETLQKKSTKKFVNSILGFSFRENTVEFEFREKYLEENFKVQYFGFVINLGVNGLLILVCIIQVALENNHGSRGRLGLFVFEEIFGMCLYYLLKKNYKSLNFAYLVQTVFSLDFFYFFVSSFFVSLPSVHLIELLFFRYLLINHCSGLFFRRSLFLNFVNFCLWIVIITLNNPEPFQYIVTIFFISLISYCRYSSEHNLRLISMSMQAATRETDKTEELLTNMLPQNALKNLKEENFSTDRLSHVTLMYADIVGFTAWSSTKTPKEVVGKLSQLFTLFDKLCLQHNVYKVCTIGDCYVVMGYQTDRNRVPAREAENVLKFAKALIEVIDDNNKTFGSTLSMRVGIHTGEVIGGITGTNIVRYDIYGADVLIANKMESNGEAGKVMVSEATKDFLEDYVPGKYLFSYHKEIHVNNLNRDIKIFEAKSNEDFHDTSSI